MPQVTKQKSLWRKVKTMVVMPIGMELATLAKFDGWDLYTDANTGAVYYYNSINGKSSWEKPKQMQTKEELNKAETFKGMRMLTKASGLMMMMKNRVDRHTEGWVQVADADGNLFYFNNQDGTSQWEKPRILEARERALAAAAASAGDALMAGVAETIGYDHAALAKQIHDTFHIEEAKVEAVMDIDSQEIPMNSLVRREWLVYEENSTRQLKKNIRNLEKELKKTKRELNVRRLLRPRTHTRKCTHTRISTCTRISTGTRAVRRHTHGTQTAIARDPPCLGPARRLQGEKSLEKMLEQWCEYDIDTESSEEWSDNVSDDDSEYLKQRQERRARKKAKRKAKKAKRKVGERAGMRSGILWCVLPIADCGAARIHMDADGARSPRSPRGRRKRSEPRRRGDGSSGSWKTRKTTN